MLRLVLISAALAFLSSQSVIAQAGFNDSYYWPLKLEKRFSSGFGDIRPGRFHMGIDLRTNGKEGAKIYAPEDGYVWRLKTSYRGYGKALYLKGISGRIYVFGHLQKYNWDIGTYLRERQIENGRYYQDLYLEEGILQVKRGEFIARTGQSGAGAPHLHFEVRDQNNFATHPLYYGISVNDKTPPRIQAIWLSCLDDSSVYAGGTREIKLIPLYNKAADRYLIADTVYIKGRFAVKAAIEDYVGKGSFSLGPSHTRLLIDNNLHHEIEYDRLNFDENIFSILDRDPDPGKKEYKRVFNLYRKTGSRLSNYRSGLTSDGSFADTAAGFHTAVIEASDHSGNTSRIEFVFYYEIAAEILAPFNKAEFTDSTISFMFAGDQSRNYFDSTALLLSGEESGADTMRVILSPEISSDDNYLTLKGDFDHITTYQLQFFKENRAYPPYYFSTENIIPAGQKAADSVHATIIDDGILFTAVSYSPGINWLQAEIITDAGNVRRFYEKNGDQRFSLYYHPGDNVRTIESIITRGQVGFRPDTVTCPVHFVRTGEESTIPLTSECSLFLEDELLFGDVLLLVRDTAMPEPMTGSFIHDPFILGPETVSFTDWADLRVEIPDDTVDPAKIGLYVYHEKDGWLWAGGKFDPATRTLHCPLGGAGVLAIISDTVAPVIADLNIKKLDRIKSSRPLVRFRLDEELSGIENDQNFFVTIDKKWIVPEYDPERKTFISKPHWSLTGGRHTLRIEVHDRCGNPVTLTREFIIGANAGP